MIGFGIRNFFLAFLFLVCKIDSPLNSCEKIRKSFKKGGDRARGNSDEGGFASEVKKKKEVFELSG